MSSDVIRGVPNRQVALCLSSKHAVNDVFPLSLCDVGKGDSASQEGPDSSPFSSQDSPTLSS